MGRGMLKGEVLEVLEGDTHCLACVRERVLRYLQVLIGKVLAISEDSDISLDSE